MYTHVHTRTPQHTNTHTNNYHNYGIVFSEEIFSMFIVSFTFGRAPKDVRISAMKIILYTVHQ